MELIIGFLIAAVVGMTGMGGGPLVVPALVLLLGMPAAEAVGTSMLYVTLIKLVASPVYMFRGQVDWPVLARLLAGGLPGVVIGSLLITGMTKANLQGAVLTVVGGIVVTVSLVNLWRLLQSGGARPEVDRSKWLPAVTFPIGIEVGFSSAGAGALGGVAMMQMTRLETARIVGTDLLFGLAVAGLGGGIHLALGQVNSSMVIKLVTGGVAGALCGAWMATRVPSRQLRFGLSAFLVFIGAQLAWRGIAGN